MQNQLGAQPAHVGGSVMTAETVYAGNSGDIGADEKTENKKIIRLLISELVDV